MEPKRFWDNQFSAKGGNPYYKVEQADLNDPALGWALSFLGSVEGQTGIDLGCGNGASVY